VRRGCKFLWPGWGGASGLVGLKRKHKKLSEMWGKPSKSVVKLEISCRTLPPRRLFTVCGPSQIQVTRPLLHYSISSSTEDGQWE
jgi:hypothetical protein